MSPTDPHPSTSVLAEYVEGSLTQDVSATTETHVEQCPTCQDVIEQLNVVRDALRDLPAERPVPEHVSARVFAALAAESSPAPPGDVVPALDADADTDTVAWFRRRAPRALAAAASVAVIGLAGYVAVTTGDGGGEMTTADSSNRAGESSEAEAGPEEPMDAQDESSVIEDELAEEGNGSGAPAPDSASLRTAVSDVWEDDAELAPGCGEALADELGLSLVGSAESGDGVLVVLEDEPAAQLHGHVVSTCGSTTAEELSAPVTLTRP